MRGSPRVTEWHRRRTRAPHTLFNYIWRWSIRRRRLLSGGAPMYTYYYIIIAQVTPSGVPDSITVLKILTASSGRFIKPQTPPSGHASFVFTLRGRIKEYNIIVYYVVGKKSKSKNDQGMKIIIMCSAVDIGKLSGGPLIFQIKTF